MSERILIIGANGKIGRITAQKLKDNLRFEPVAMLRKKEQKTFFDQLGVETVMGDLSSDVDTLANLMQGFEAIVFTAGSGGQTGYDQTLAIDLDGAVKTFEAAEKAGVHRYVMVSALHADNRDAWEQSGIKPYYIAKHYADRLLRASSLKYTILRPARLLDEPGTGKIAASLVGAKLQIPREDVASVIVEVLKSDSSQRKLFDLVSGDVPIDHLL